LRVSGGRSSSSAFVRAALCEISVNTPSDREAQNKIASLGMKEG